MLVLEIAHHERRRFALAIEDYQLMRILYDGEVYSMQVAGGINRYFANLIGRLPANFYPSLLLNQTREVNYPAHPNLRVYRYDHSRLEHISYRLSLFCSKLENHYLDQLLAFQSFDLMHPTYYTLLTQQKINSARSPVVLTVWDMIHELFRAQMDPLGRHAEEKRKAIEAAQAIICISENTKQDLLEHYSIPENKVWVTYLASEIDASISHGPEPTPARPYYLYVGSRASYKNFNGLLNALAEVVSVKPEVVLCVVGSSFVADEENLIAGLKLTNHIEHYGNVSDQHLAKLYRCSLALVYPSLYEGFGIPPLEAMACGTVVVACNNSSLPEVVGKAGILFDPQAPGDLVDMLLSLINDAAKRERLIALGYQKVQEFTWDKTVAKTLEVYSSVCN